MKHDDEPTYYSRAWKTTSTPDLALATNDLSKNSTRNVMPPLATSDHKPVIVTVSNTENNTIPRWNYKKADWSKFGTLTDQYTAGIKCKAKKVYKSSRKLTKAILKAAKESIPRGARKDNRANWSPELAKLHPETIDIRYTAETQPSVESNIEMKKSAAKYRIASNTASRNNWDEKTASFNYEKDGGKLWNLVKSMNGEYDN